MTVTKKELDELRANLAKPEWHLSFTPDGATVQIVNQELYTRQNKQLKSGERSLMTAQEKLRTDLELVRNQGASRAEFNALNHTDECNLKL